MLQFSVAKNEDTINRPADDPNTPEVKPAPAPKKQ